MKCYYKITCNSSAWLIEPYLTCKMEKIFHIIPKNFYRISILWDCSEKLSVTLRYLKFYTITHVCLSLMWIVFLLFVSLFDKLWNNFFEHFLNFFYIKQFHVFTSNCQINYFFLSDICMFYIIYKVKFSYLELINMTISKTTIYYRIYFSYEWTIDFIFFDKK